MTISLHFRLTLSIDEYFYLLKKKTIFMIYVKILKTILIIIPLMSLNSFGNTTDKNNVVDFVKSFVKNNIELPLDGKVEISVPAIDPRINIKPCISALKANIPEKHNGRNVNVKIYCEDVAPWQLFIPVRINQEIPVLVTMNVLAKGTVINDINTRIEYINVNRIRGESVDKVELVTGGRLKRRLAKGAVVSPRNICLVCKGEMVTIIAESDDFMIKTAGLALTSGSKGEQVKIKNSKSGRTINARVQAVNKVVINL